MALTAHFYLPPEERDSRRSIERRPLRLDIEGEANDGRRFDAVVHNLSEDGLLIEAAVPIGIGEHLRLDFPNGREVDLVVAWRSGDFVGCSFSAPIGKAEISAAMLKSAFVPPAPAEPALEAARSTEFLEEEGDALPALSRRTRSWIILGLGLLAWLPIIAIVRMALA